MDKVITKNFEKLKELENLEFGQASSVSFKLGIDPLSIEVVEVSKKQI